MVLIKRFVSLCSIYSIYEYFMQVVSSAIIDKYIGESARLIREMFGYARDHQVIFSLTPQLLACLCTT